MIVRRKAENKRLSTGNAGNATQIKLAKGAENPLEFGHGVLSILCDVYHDGCAYAM